jgi:hypothetical protein
MFLNQRLFKIEDWQRFLLVMVVGGEEWKVLFSAKLEYDMSIRHAKKILGRL